MEQLKTDLLEAQEALIAKGNSAKENVYAEKQKQREISLSLQQEHNEQVPPKHLLLMRPHTALGC